MGRIILIRVGKRPSRLRVGQRYGEQSARRCRCYIERLAVLQHQHRRHWQLFLWRQGRRQLHRHACKDRLQLQSSHSNFQQCQRQPDANFTASPFADLSLAVSDSPDPVATLGNITYTFTITNNGPLAASGVSFTQGLPVKPDFCFHHAKPGKLFQIGSNPLLHLGLDVEQRDCLRDHCRNVA